MEWLTPDLKVEPVDLDLEFAAILLKKTNILVICVYRSGARQLLSHYHIFLKELDNLLNSVKHKYRVILAGDFNVKINAQTQTTEELINLLSSLGLCPTITEPTRISGSCENTLDNIITNINVYKYCSFNKFSGLSDH